MLCGNRSLAELLETACLMEVMSPKPGNVGPGKNFADASIEDFLKSARAISPILAAGSPEFESNGPHPQGSVPSSPGHAVHHHGSRGLGDVILNAVQATRTVVQHNTNLGIILLLAPLAMVPREQTLSQGIAAVLSSTTVNDSRQVYEAIRIAQPTGLGQTDEQDLCNEPTVDLVECMRLAADRDMVAAQYANGFEQVLRCGQDWLREAAETSLPQPQQITLLSVRLLAAFGDSLIARKCGQQMSDEVRDKAQKLLISGWPAKDESSRQYAEFDSFLRADGNRRNPGTTADLVTAILFAALRDGTMIPNGSWDSAPSSYDV